MAGSRIHLGVSTLLTLTPECQLDPVESHLVHCGFRPILSRNRPFPATRPAMAATPARCSWQLGKIHASCKSLLVEAWHCTNELHKDLFEPCCIFLASTICALILCVKGISMYSLQNHDKHHIISDHICRRFISPLASTLEMGC